MDKYERFKHSIETAVEKFKELDRKETIRIISHLDADGISAAAILIKLLNLDNRRYSISILPQLKEEIIKEFIAEDNNVYFFTDLGSGQLSLIKKYLRDKTVFILDHHDMEPDNNIPNHITHINPHTFGIDGSREISGAGVVYLFARNIKKDLGMAHVAIIGAIGDVQEDKGFLNLNDEILKEAVKDGKLSVTKGIRFFGRNTRPLHKVLEYTNDPFIPGVTGSESGAIQFLKELNIKPNNEKGWRKVVDLSNAEMKRLVEGIIVRRMDEKNPDDILGNIYTLPNEDKSSPTRNAKEFSTLLNACGRLSKASLGIGACLGNEKIKKQAINHLISYKREIVKSLNWVRNQKDSNSQLIKKGKGYIIINAQDNIISTMIGTTASIMSKSNDLKEGTYILALAQCDDGSTKASLRIAGKRMFEGVDLRDVINEIVRESGGEAGGHQYAAGAMIPAEKESKFIKIAKRVLSKKALEERVES